MVSKYHQRLILSRSGVGANAAFTDAEFRRSTNFVTFAENTPPNVAEVTGNLWTSYSEIGGTLEIGGSFNIWTIGMVTMLI